MAGPPVVVVESGGLPVTQVASGAPVLTAVTSGGLAITLTPNGAPFVIEGAVPPTPIWQNGIFVAGNNVFGWGYASAPIVSAPLGSLITEPYTGARLVAFFEAPDDSRVIVVFEGDVVSELEGHTFNINGAVLGVMTPAVYNPGSNLTIMYLEPHWMIDGEAYIITRVPASIPASPENLSVPAITGVPQVGATLIGSDGVWSNEPTSFAYQWQLSANGTSGWANISGASSPTYGPILSQEGQYLRIGVAASNEGGSSAPAYSLSAGPVEAVAPPVLEDITVNDVTFNATYPLTTTTTTSCTVNVSSGNSRKLLAVVALLLNETVTGVTAGGVPMTLVAGNVVGVDGTRYQNVSIWELDAPAVGSTVITATRNGTGSARFGVAGFVLHNAAHEPAVDVSPIYFSATDSTTYTGNSVTATREGQLAFFVYSNELFLTGNSVALSNGTSGGRIWTSGGTTSVLPYWKEVSAAGTVPSATLTIGDSGARNCQGLAVLFNNTTSGGPVDYNRLYIDAEDGSDANDGHSPEDALQSYTQAQIAPQTSDTEYFFKTGQRHYLKAPLAASTPPIAIASSVHLQPYGDAGEDARIGGDIVAGDWSTLSAGEASSFAITNGLKKAVDTSANIKFVYADDFMLYPAMWCPGGYPTDISSFTDFQKGSAAIHYAASVQLSGAAATVTPDFSKEVAYERGASGYFIYFTHPSIATHYGNIGASALNGGYATYLDVSNTERIVRIVGYDYANSRIKAAMGSGAEAIPHQSVSVWYAFRFVPYDIFTVGQFGYSSDSQTVYATFPAHTTKSVSSATLGMSLRGDGAHVEGLTFGRIDQSAISGGTRPTISVGADSLILKDIRVEQCYDTARSAAVYASLPSNDLEVDGVTGTKIYSNGLVRMVNTVTYSSFKNLYGREAGRTMLSFTGGLSGPAHHNTAQNMDFNDHMAVHGNGLTTYAGAHNISFNGVAAMGTSHPYTTQVKNAQEIVTPRNNKVEGFIFSHPRSIAGTLEGAHIIRIDGGETGSLISCGTSVIAANSGLYLGVEADGTSVYNNSGLVVVNCVIEGVASAASPSGVSGVTFRHCLILQGDGVGQTKAALEALGATFENCTFVTLTTGNRAAGTGGAWNGTFTTSMQEHLTRAPTWTSGNPVYRSVTIGPQLWGEDRSWGPWVIPAYGSTFALNALHLTTTKIWEGYQAHRQIGSVVGAMPGSTLSLVSGAGDNSKFILDPRGMVRANVALTKGSYALVVRETNSSATNGPTLDTTITILVEGY